MFKDNLIELLEKYNSEYKEEQEYKKDILNFINNNKVIIGKENKNGHITGSAWIVSKDRKKVLILHHNKLNRWFQPGGHVDEGESIFEASIREAKEETGLESIISVSNEIFDIDNHSIPPKKDEKEHIHYDIRFIFEGDSNENVVISDESKDVRWVDINDIKIYTESKSILRMVEKIKNKIL